MKVVLLQDIPSIGRAFEIIDVKDGYARNYLIPKKMAERATPGKIKDIEHRKKFYSAQMEQKISKAQALAQKLDGLALKASLKIGTKGKSFGSITAAEVAELLEAQGIRLNRRLLGYEWPIKAPGVYTITAKIHAQISCEFKLWVGEE